MVNMITYQYPKSQELFQRAAAVIPCGIYGHFSPAPLIPATAYPFYTEKTAGARFWDVDGNEFIDYMCAYGPMVLGYHHPAVEAAAAQAAADGNCTTGAPPVMVELAEYLVNLITGMDWAFFAKNGGDTTHYAVMIARDATNRKKIIMIKGGYHGVAPWMQAPGHHGLVDTDWENIIRIPWNDIGALERAVAAHPNDIAGFIATPYHIPAFEDSMLPADGYWRAVESICRKNGIILISDDIRHGFRIDMRGSHAFYGFQPDLVCFCKAIANGYPISALMGTDALKNVAARIFYTGSYWFQSQPMAAALATLKELAAIDGPAIMRNIGDKLRDGLVEAGKAHGFDVKITGATAMPYVRITNDESLMTHQQWCAECTRRGAYFTPHHNWFVSTAHTEDDIAKTIDIAADAFAAISKK